MAEVNRPSINHPLTLAFSICYAFGFLAGMIYSWLNQRYIQFSLDTVLLIIMAFIAIFQRKRGGSMPLLMTVAAYGALVVFFSDAIINLITPTPQSPLRLLGDGAVILAVSAFISLFSQRLLALLAGISAALIFLLFSLMYPASGSLEFNIYVQPAFWGIALFLYHYRKISDTWAEMLRNQANRLPMLDLNTFKITEAEFACITGLVAGKSTKEIAMAEGCSESAIQGRLNLIFRKFKVEDRSSLLLILAKHELKWHRGT